MPSNTDLFCSPLCRRSSSHRGGILGESARNGLVRGIEWRCEQLPINFVLPEIEPLLAVAFIATYAVTLQDSHEECRRWFGVVGSQ